MYFVFFSEVNSRSHSLYVIARPSVCRLSVKFVHPTQAIEIFGNLSMPFGTLAITAFSIKILRLGRYERISVQNRRFCSNGGRLTQNFRLKGSPPPTILLLGKLG